MIANNIEPPATARLGTGWTRLARTTQVLAVMAIGAGLVLAIVGVGVIAAVGKTVPTQLWDVITALSGALLGMLIPSPTQRRAVKAQRLALADNDVRAAGLEAIRTANAAKQAADEAAQAAKEATEAAEKQGEADQAAKTAQQKAGQAAEAQATHAMEVQAKAAAAMGAGSPASKLDWRIVVAVVLAFAAAGVAAWLYTGPGQDSQCLASVGTLTTTVAQPAASTGTTTSAASTPPSGGAPANAVTNVSTVTIGQIATPHPKAASASAAGTPQILKTAAGSSTKCPAVATGDSLLAVALGVLAAILGILVPSFKLPETTEAPTA
jgi:hypothetical protein